MPKPVIVVIQDQQAFPYNSELGLPKQKLESYPDIGEIAKNLLGNNWWRNQRTRDPFYLGTMGPISETPLLRSTLSFFLL